MVCCKGRFSAVFLLLYTQKTTRPKLERMREHSVCQCCKFEDNKHEKDVCIYIHSISFIFSHYNNSD